GPRAGPPRRARRATRSARRATPRAAARRRAACARRHLRPRAARRGSGPQPAGSRADSGSRRWRPRSPGGPLAYGPRPRAAVARRASPAEIARAPEPLRMLRRGGRFVLAIDALEGESLRLGLLERDGLARLLARTEPGPPGRTQTALVALAGGAGLHLRPARRRGPRGGFGGERGRGVGRGGRAAAAAGRALRRFHDLGGRHRDLHAGNLLLRETEACAEALLVDLDRACCGAPPAAA